MAEAGNPGPGRVEPAGRVDTVCSDCAVKAGGVWPSGHCATFSMSACEACGAQRATCSVDDFDWPNGRPKGWQGTWRD